MLHHVSIAPRVLVALALALSAGACAADAAGASEAVEEDLGLLSAKADGGVREVRVALAPGETKRFRVTAVGFAAALLQDGAGVEAQLSAKHYEHNLLGAVAVDATVRAEADEQVRRWTLRVQNLGAARLSGSLRIASLDRAPEAAPAAAHGEELRRMALTLGPGEVKWYRVAAVGIVAELSQTGQVAAQLSAKHYEHDVYGAAGVAPTVAVDPADGVVRNWTLRVHNLGSEVLEADVTVYAAPRVELGIISDIDKTVLPPHADGDPMPLPYPGIAALLQTLELGSAGGQGGDVYYVTARRADMIGGIAEWMADSGVPAGPIEPGVDSFWLAQAEKVADISAILDAHPTQRFVLLGDSNHRDPEVYREIKARYGDRVVAGFIHRVNNVNPDRLEGLVGHGGYAEVAAALAGLQVLTRDEARGIMDAARLEGAPLTEADIDALLAAAAPE